MFLADENSFPRPQLLVININLVLTVLLLHDLVELVDIDFARTKHFLKCLPINLLFFKLNSLNPTKLKKTIEDNIAIV